ncbi:MAG: hypothetical protein JWM15_774 [Cryptosporangiaceae bacterium]|jgi:hypothetical protein|nr:hypothetical protein [Cryptosporangiaceae bacterium]
MAAPREPRDAAHAAEEPGVLSEYGNDTGFAGELLGVELPEPPPVADADTPRTEDH